MSGKKGGYMDIEILKRKKVAELREIAKPCRLTIIRN